jgi:hypothetical protein
MCCTYCEIVNNECELAAILVGASESGDELEELGSDSDTMEHLSEMLRHHTIQLYVT